MDPGRCAGIFAERLSGLSCRTQVLVIRDFATTCTCTCQHCYAIFLHSACLHVHTYALCGYTLHLCTCRYAAIHVNRPSGISQAAAIAVNRTQGVKCLAQGHKRRDQPCGLNYGQCWLPNYSMCFTICLPGSLRAWATRSLLCLCTGHGTKDPHLVWCTQQGNHKIQSKVREVTVLITWGR